MESNLDQQILGGRIRSTVGIQSQKWSRVVIFFKTRSMTWASGYLSSPHEPIATRLYISVVMGMT